MILCQRILIIIIITIIILVTVFMVLSSRHKVILRVLSCCILDIGKIVPVEN